AHHEALACELAGRFWRAHGRDQVAATYLRRAVDGYRRWGAGAVVERVLREHGSLVDEPKVAAAGLGSILEASQAISQEVELDRLIARILAISIEHTGAEHGAVVVKEEAGLVTYATFTPGGVPLEASTDVPASLVRYVLRTGRPVALDDAATDAAFGRD